MCGIVGYVGDGRAVDRVLAGLRRLEYRGYDSAGIAVVADGVQYLRKRAGKLARLEELLAEDPLPASGLGIGHTRWATHGAPNDVNAHPHISADGRIAVIHNGIIENFAELRAELTSAGVQLSSETDSEVAAHLIERELIECEQELAEAVRRVCIRLTGAFTLVVTDARSPGLLVGARRNSPLVAGVGDGEMFLASDVSAFIEFTRRAIELGQDQVVVLTADSARVIGFDGREVEPGHFEVTWDASAAEKGGFDLYMLKEIAEQPRAVADTLLGRIGDDGRLILDGVDLPAELLLATRKIIIIACGTAYHAGMVAKYAIEHWTGIACEVELASEFRYRDPIVDTSTLVISISQSGETADTLMAQRYAREQGAMVLAICNTQGSTIAREADAVLYTRAGPEIAVASTKAFLTQLVACYLVALYLAQVRGDPRGSQIDQAIRDLADMPRKVDLVLDTTDGVRALARETVNCSSVLFIGRNVGYPVALEGALKLKELAYMHAEGFAAGELKHGPIALIEDGIPVIVVVPPRDGRDELHQKIVSNIQEVRARGARTIVVAGEGDESVTPYADAIIRIPNCPPLLQPLVDTVPLQVFACELATAKGHDVDQPRNLAKSVTVE